MRSEQRLEKRQQLNSTRTAAVPPTGTPRGGLPDVRTARYHAHPAGRTTNPEEGLAIAGVVD